MIPYQGLLLKYSEVFLKAGSRKRFIRRLQGNVQKQLKGFEELVRITVPYGHLFVRFKRAPSEAEYRTILTRLTLVFGLVRVVPVRMVDKTLAAMGAACCEEAAATVARMGRDDLRYRLTVKRADKSFQPRSDDIVRQLAVDVYARFPSFEVDLEEHELNLQVEVRDEAAYIYAQRIEGAGGLPVGANGSLTLLLSGGIDSPIAGVLAMKRGCTLRGVFFDSFPLIGREARRKVEVLAGLLARFQGRFELTVVPFAPIQEHFKAEAPHRELVLMYRRSMYRLAERWMRERRDLGLVTGDSLGQVASQTVPNMACLDDAVEAIVLRPLTAYDKEETVALSRRLGFFEASTSAAEDPCSLFMPRHPQLKGKPAFLREVEERLGDRLRALEDAAFEGRETVVLYPPEGP